MGVRRLEDPQVLLSILDNLPTSIFIKDEDLNFVYSNALHCRMIGKPEEALLGKCDSDFYPPEEARGFLAHDKKVITTGETDYSEEFASNDSGMTLPVLTRKSKHVAPDGKTYLIGTNTDLTDIKKREDQYKALSQTVPVGIVQIEESGTITFSNPLFNAYAGGDGDVEARDTLVNKIAAAHPEFPGKACKFETDFTVVGMPTRSVIVISSGWLAMGQDQRSAIVSVVDVSEMTELRRINSEISRLNKELAANMKRLKEAQDELVKKGRMEQLGQLTATIAHEIRNPLGSVRTSTFLLERKLKDKGLGVEAQIDRINKGVIRCDNIITQLLDFSRTKQLNAQADDLDKWLMQVVDEEAKRMPAAVSIHLDLGLDGRLVPFDPSRLQRAVVNLLSNASEAMVGQGDDPSKYAVAEPQISVVSRVEGGHAVIEVTDNGPGIPPDVLARIREPLFTTKSFGTGLGVPAIEQIAIQHGGTLEITSQPGEGARFTMRIPLEVSSDSEKAA
jgi:PAS domain S-box-containing protein